MSKVAKFGLIILTVGCVLVDPKKNKYFLYCRLELECTNNTIEYKALVQGLKKSIGLEVKNLKILSSLMLHSMINNPQQ